MDTTEARFNAAVRTIERQGGRVVPFLVCPDQSDPESAWACAVEMGEAEPPENDTFVLAHFASHTDVHSWVDGELVQTVYADICLCVCHLCGGTGRAYAEEVVQVGDQVDYNEFHIACPDCPDARPCPEHDRDTASPIAVRQCDSIVFDVIPIGDYDGSYIASVAEAFADADAGFGFGWDDADGTCTVTLTR